MRSPFSPLVCLAVVALLACESQDPGNRDTSIRDFSRDAGEPMCIHGAAFITCPGSEMPKLFCSSQRCKWVSFGSPVAEYQSAADTSCNCTGTTCPADQVLQRFIYARGTKPWTRERDLIIPVKVDKSIGPGTTTFTCTNCGNACLAGDHPCNANPAGVVLRECPGTCVFLLGTLGGLYGWHLEIEIDFGYPQPRARACMIPFTDAVSCMPGVPSTTCATSGTLTIDSAGNTAIAGIFDLQFPNGFVINGTFPAK